MCSSDLAQREGEQAVNTAIAITAIIAAVALLNSGITALRDVAKAKHAATRCPNCGRDNSKENEA